MTHLAPESDADAADTAGRQPNPIDTHVGGRIRLRRKLLGISQEGLAEHLGLTFQQVQKYERGTNRVSASKLYEVARKLDVGIGYFFEGLDELADGQDGPNPLLAMVGFGGGIEIARRFTTMSIEGRTAMLATARALTPGAVWPAATRPAAVAEAA